MRYIHIMRKVQLVLAAVVFTIISSTTLTSPAHARTCGFSWAKPGTYIVSGNFRGRTESAGVQLSRDCRVNLRIPGVFSGTRVRKSGRCLRFSFKVNGHKRLYRGHWCNRTGRVNWKGRTIRVRVKRVRRGSK